MAPHSSTLTWKIPWMEEPGRLQSMGSLGVGHDWVASLSLFTFMHWRRKWQPTPVFLPGESQGRGSLVGWAAVYGVAQSRTRLKRLSSSSSSSKVLQNEKHYRTAQYFLTGFAFFILEDSKCDYRNLFIAYKQVFSGSAQFSSVAQSCPTLCDPMNHSTPGLPVHHLAFF